MLPCMCLRLTAASAAEVCIVINIILTARAGADSGPSTSTDQDDPFTANGHGEWLISLYALLILT